MKVFISSLITGLELIRAAAKAAIETLGHEAIMAEDFGAMPQTPQMACLDGVRQAGAVVLILGQRYSMSMGKTPTIISPSTCLPVISRGRRWRKVWRPWWTTS